MKAFVPSQTKGVSPATLGRASQTTARTPRPAVAPSRAHHSGALKKPTNTLEMGMRLLVARGCVTLLLAPPAFYTQVLSARLESATTATPHS